MKFKINQTYIKKTIKNLSLIPSPTGMTDVAVNFVAKELDKFKIKYTRTNRGSLIARVNGKKKSPCITFSAHLDTLGAMVRGVKSDGRINVFSIGGYNWNSVHGEYVTIHTSKGKTYRGTCLPACASVHVFTGDVMNKPKKFEDMEIRLDEDVENAEDVAKLGISVGDYISFDTRIEVLKNGFIKSRYLDDKAGVVSILAMLEALSLMKKKPERDVCIVFSTFEETGSGVSGIPEDSREFFAVDMGVIGGEHEGDEKKVSICPMDGSGPYSRDLFIHLVNLAEKDKLEHAKDIFIYYGSDASGVSRACIDVKTALIGPGVHASHALERTHVKGIEQTSKLILAYVFNPLP